MNRTDVRRSETRSDFDDTLSRLVDVVEMYARVNRGVDIRTGGAAAVSRAFYEFQWLSVWLDLNDPIVPGQPLQFTWSANTLHHGNIDLGKVTARLFLLDQNSNRVFPNSPIFTMILPGTDITPKDYVSPVQSLRLPSNDPQAALFYSATENHGVELELSGDGKNPGPFLSWAQDLNVVLEDPGVTWQWTDPTQSKDVAWKALYFLAGNILNPSQYSAKHYNITLIEHDMTTGADQPHGPDNQPPQINVNGGHVTVPFGGVNGFSQNWQWFITFVNKLSAGTTRNFAYDLRVDISDEYGNNYPTRTIGSYAYVFVTVADQKKNAAAAGYVSFVLFVGVSALAIALAWVPGLGAALGAAAAAAAAVASGCSKIADDPPVPDSRYRNKVHVEVPDVLEPLRQQPSLSHVHTVFATAFHIVASLEALSEIESRILGARQDQNQPALEMQEASYQEIARGLAEDGKRIVESAIAAADQLDLRELITPQDLEKVMQSLKNGGLTNLLRHGSMNADVLRLLRLADIHDIPEEKVAEVGENVILMASYLRRLTTIGSSPKPMTHDRAAR